VLAPLTPRSDGALSAHGRAAVTMTGERLHVRVDARGLHDLMVWGSGPAAAVSFEPPLPADATVTITPNHLHVAWRGGALAVSLDLERPLLLVRASGQAPTLRLVCPRSLPDGFHLAPVRRRLDDGWVVSSDWAHTLLRAPGGRHAPGGRLSLGPGGVAVVAAGADAAEAERAAAEGLVDPDQHDQRRERYHGWLRRSFWSDDAVLSSLALHGLHAARSSRRTLPDGRFAGFAAGSGYALPARTYFRDAYWTLQALLPLAPELAREQLSVLATAVDADGAAPSGVIITTSAGARSWRARRAADPALARDHPGDGIWWADHSDSPLYFVLLAAEVAAWTQRSDVWWERSTGVSVAERVSAVLERSLASSDAAGLPHKPYHDRDWADNVYRSGAVSYQAGLAYGALRAAAAAFEDRDADRARRYRSYANRLRAAATQRLWRAEAGHFVEFREANGRCETHLAIDTLTLLRYGLASRDQAASTLAAMRARLETRHNRDQPYGDWGVMCVFPPYASWVERRAKSRFAFRYHNGADWPYWDGVYAEQRLVRGLPGWRYPLTRWWRYGLERGWATPVEYFAPPYAPGSATNGWSAMPAAALLLGGFGLDPSGTARTPPWGVSGYERTLPGGRRQRGRVDASGTLEVEHDG